VSASPTGATYVFEVDEADFGAAVVERSHETPVIVDFWAAWCGPCRTLGPMLEQAVATRGGDVLLAKVDVDRNQRLAQTFRVQGIPQVIAFRAGHPVAQFTGVVPEATLTRFIDELVPSPADRAVARARALPAPEAEAELRTALELDPGHREASIGLADLVLDHDPDEALRLVHPHRPDPAAEAIVTRAELARDGGGDVEGLRVQVAAGDADASTYLALGRALAAQGVNEEAIDCLLSAVALGGDGRERAREQLVALFGVLGDDHELVRAARPRLARALY
jgi:putative thioredoxin